MVTVVVVVMTLEEVNVAWWWYSHARVGGFPLVVWCALFLHAFAVVVSDAALRNVGVCYNATT